jgi:hypothetical protein
MRGKLYPISHDTCDKCVMSPSATSDVIRSLTVNLGSHLLLFPNWSIARSVGQLHGCYINRLKHNSIPLITATVNMLNKQSRNLWA